MALMALARAVCSTSCSFLSDSSRVELPRHSKPSTSAKLCTGRGREPGAIVPPPTHTHTAQAHLYEQRIFS